MTAQLLTEDDYINLLVLRFNNPEIKFEKAELKSLTENLEGFLGDHNVLQITYSLNGETATVNFFVKSKPKLQSSANMADQLLAYEKEIFFYEKLMKDFENRGYNISFAPETYLCKDNSIIVMNDLKSDGYYLAGRTTFYDLVKLKSSLKALAYFHAASLIYEEEKSVELNRNFRLGLEYPEMFVEKFLDLVDEESVGYKFVQQSKECILTLIKALEENAEWTNDFIHRMNYLNFLEIFTKDLGARKALGHGDLWSNNLLFKQQNEELQCCIVDYQILRYFNPAFDVLYLIFINTRQQFRNVHLDTLLNYYYDSLKQILREKNLKIENIYSQQDYMKSIKYYKFLARFDAACGHTLTLLDVNKLNEVLVDKTMEELVNDDRASLVLEAFKCDEIFAEIMKENLYEIRDLLIQHMSNN